MARPDDQRIVADLPTLSGALRQAIGTRAELPIRFLYELKRNPDASISDVAGRLDIPQRTAFRWLAWYREGGLRRYISRPWRESTGQSPGSSGSGLGLPEGPGEHRSEFYAYGSLRSVGGTENVQGDARMRCGQPDRTSTK